MSYDTPEDEMVHRLRRIETRLTKFLTVNGLDTGALKPERVGEAVQVPGYYTALSDILALVPPEERPCSVPVFLGSRYIGTIHASEGDDE